jgi:MFS family permease
VDVALHLIYPLVPLFLVSVLGASYVDVGVIEGAAESTAGLLKAFSGWFSDRLGTRKPLVALGYSASAMSKPLLSLASDWTDVLGLRFLDRFGKGARTSARDAIIAESCNESPGKAFGCHRAMDSAGAVVGSVAASILLALSFGFSQVFLIAFVPALLAVVILLLFVRETTGTACAVTGRAHDEARLNPRDLSGRFRRSSWFFQYSPLETQATCSSSCGLRTSAFPS